MDEIDEFISILNAECEWLKNNDYMQKHIEEGWRSYSLPLCGEPDDDHFQAVFEAGKYTVEAESCLQDGCEDGAWRALAKAQAALLRSLSQKGKAVAKKEGQKRGGRARGSDLEVFCMIEDFLLSGEKKRGLARKVVDKLLANKGIVKTERQVNVIIKRFLSEGFDPTS